MADILITQSNIQFTSVDNNITKYTGWSKKYTHANNLGGSTYPFDSSDIAFSMNAVEIDFS